MPASEWSAAGTESSAVPPNDSESRTSSAGRAGDLAGQVVPRLVIPLRPGLRSLNIAVAAAMAAGEALRQTGGMPGAVNMTA